MAKKKIKETEVYVEVIQSEDPEPANGKGVGAYWDKEAKRFILVELDLYPVSGLATVVSTKTLRTSKIGTIMELKIKLEQLFEKEFRGAK